MATRVADRAVLDTNVLLAASDEGRPEHTSAMIAINEWPSSGMALYTSGQILREYVAVATRPTERNGLGLQQADVVANVRALRARLRLMAEDVRVSDRLLTLLDAVECSGKQVHDANIVATMLVHGVDTLVTSNIDDFRRFNNVRVIGLDSARRSTS